MTPTPPEAIEAALALVDRMANRKSGNFSYQTSLEGGKRALDSNDYDEARRIAALLPKPVDEAVLAAREIAAADYDEQDMDYATAVRRGECDGSRSVRIALASYRAGAASTKGRG